MKFEPTPVHATVTVELVGGKKGPVELDDDLMFIGRITDKAKQSIKVITNNKGKIVTKTYSLSGLTLATK